MEKYNKRDQLKKIAAIFFLFTNSLQSCFEDSFNDDHTVINNFENNENYTDSEIQQSVDMIQKYRLYEVCPEIKGQWNLLQSYLSLTQTDENILEIKKCLTEITRLIKEHYNILLEKWEHIPEGIYEFLVLRNAIVCESNISKTFKNQLAETFLNWKTISRNEAASLI